MEIVFENKFFLIKADECYIVLCCIVCELRDNFIIPPYILLFLNFVASFDYAARKVLILESDSLASYFKWR